MRDRASYAPLPLRLVLGFGFLYHGVPKVFTAEGNRMFRGMLEQIGVPAPGSMSYAVGVAEVAAGAALILGVLVGLASALMIANMLVALFTVHLPHGFNFLNITGMTEQGPQFGMPGYEVNLLSTSRVWRRWPCGGRARSRWGVATGPRRVPAQTGKSASPRRGSRRRKRAPSAASVDPAMVVRREDPSPERNPVSGAPMTLAARVRGCAPLLVLVYLLTYPAALRGQDAAASSRPAALEAMAAYVGHWRSDDKQDQRGSRFHFELELEWFDPGRTVARLVISRVAEERTVLFEGFKGHDPVTGGVYYFAASPSGRGARGEVVLEGPDLVTAYDGWSADGRVVGIRDIFTPVEAGGDAFVSRTYLRSAPDGDWRRIAEDHWRRIGTD